MEPQEILTEDILERCEQHHRAALYEWHRNLVLHKADLAFILADRVFWSFVEDNERKLGRPWEEPMLEDIQLVVERDFLKLD